MSYDFKIFWKVWGK